jgi:PAS domain S-box-containing protein
MSELASWILDDLPVGVWVGRAPSGEIAYVNQAFREILGVGATIGSRVENAAETYRVRDRQGRLYPEERLPFRQVVATGHAVVVDDVVIHRDDGRRINVRATGNPMRDAEGRLTHVVVAFIDNTREVEAEAARATVEARLRHTVDHAPIIVFCMDAAGVVTLSEGAGLKALGFRPGELIGRSVYEMYKDTPSVTERLRRVLGGETVASQNRLGDAVLETRMTPLRDAAGTIIGVLGVSHDRTDLSRLEDSAIQNDRVMAMGALAASVAHEINNPLTYMLSNLDGVAEALGAQLAALTRVVPPSPELAAIVEAGTRAFEQLRPVRQGVERIAAITRDLRAFGRPDDARLEPVDVRRAVDSVLKLMRKDLEARARLVLAYQPAPPVMANEARLAQVVLNLLMNAMQSLQQGRSDRDEIAVSTRTQGSEVIFEVADTGPGVPAEDRERIFEPFVTTKGEGTGLGLFVCRNIVRGLGGRIDVTDRPGGGALFRVTLPAASSAAAAVARPRAEAAATRAAGLRVLLIDDDLMVARALAAQLRAAGFVAELTGDARQALERLRAGESFDILFCDLMMTGMTGMDFAAALGAAELERVVFMSGGAFTSAAAAFVAAHPERCVEKPFNVVAEAHRRLRARAARG